MADMTLLSLLLTIDRSFRVRLLLLSPPLQCGSLLPPLPPLQCGGLLPPLQRGVMARL